MKQVHKSFFSFGYFSFTHMLMKLLKCPLPK